MSIITEVVDLDEKMARDLLVNNTGNRPFKHEAIARYARDLAAGRWLMDGAPIKISDSGRLLDGQNRCAAVIKANEGRDPSTPEIVMPVLMVWGLENKAQDVMDSGVKRTVSDQLGRSGAKYASAISAGVKLVILFEGPGLFSKFSPTTLEALEYIRTHPEFEEYASTAYHLNYRAGLLFHNSALTAAMFLIHRAAGDSDDAGLFFEQLIQGTDLDPNSPILALRQRLTQAKVNRERVTNAIQLSLIIRTWNAHRTGKSLTKVPVLTRGKMIQPKKIEA